MTEVRIFELLCGQNSIICDDNKENPRLNRTKVEILSKYAADLIYATKSSKSAADLNKRLDTIKLLQEWSCSYVDHFKVTTDNYGCLLKCLELAPKSDPDSGDGFTDCPPDIDGEFVEASNSRLRDEIVVFDKRRRERTIKRDGIKAFVRNFDNKLLCERKFSQLIPKARVVNDNDDFRLIIDRFLPHDTNSERPVYIDTDKSDRSCSHTSDLAREKQTDAIYALMNVNKTLTDSTASVIEKILENVSKGDVLKPPEKAVVRHLWENYSNEVKMDVLLLRRFNFLFETIGIGVCKRLLVDPGYVLTDDQQLWRLKVAGEQDTDLYVDIKNMFYELFACSSYNENLLPVLDFF